MSVVESRGFESHVRRTGCSSMCSVLFKFTRFVSSAPIER